jgi:hypothetical protein
MSTSPQSCLRTVLALGGFTLAAMAAAPGQEAPSTGEFRSATSTAQLDVLMLYTPAARTYAGGVNAMKAAIYSHIALANRCYSNSDMPITLRPTAMMEVDYTEAGTLNEDLARLQNPADGHMDEVIGLRNTYGGDLVALIRRNDAAGVAGIAYVNTGNGDSGFSSWAFSVTADIWASGNLAFPHEIGHNLGCNHDRQNASGATHPYAYGWRFQGGNNVQYISVMAYYPGTRIPHFSNPTIRYQGTATGVASGASAADNALRHEVTAAGMAAYRNTASLPGSGVRGDFNGDGKVDIVLSNTSNGARQVWLMSGNSRDQLITLPSGSAPWQVATIADMNADGHSDIIYQNVSTGERSIALMNGVVRTGTATLATGAPEWRIVGAADFSGDAKPDLLFQNVSTGARSIGVMNGTARVGTLPLAAGSPAWRMMATADFNGDGKTDIIYQNLNTGERSIVLMDGATRLAAVVMPTGDPAWQVMAAADFNNDGKPDLLFQNIHTGACSIGLMDGTTRTTSMAAPAATGAAWRVGNR